MLPVDYQSNVGQVESHAEGVGADDDLHGRIESAREPPQQHVALVRRTESGVEEGEVHSQEAKPGPELVSDVDGGHEQHGTTSWHDPEELRDQGIPLLIVLVRQTDES